MNLKIIVVGNLWTQPRTFCETIAMDWREIDLNPKARGTWYEHLYHYATFEIDEQTILEIHKSEPSSRRFDYMWEIFAEGMIGFVVLLDSNKSQSFRDFKSTLATFSAYCPTPFVIAANNQDLEGAWDAESLRIVLRIPPEIPIIPCVATDKKSVANVLLALCEEVLRDLDDEAEA